jgi:hypothetical protein
MIKESSLKKSGVGRNEKLGEGGEVRNTPYKTFYMCDRRLTDDEGDLFATTVDEYCIQPRAWNPSMPALPEVGNGFPIHKA